MKILLVEDDQDLSRSLTKLLKKEQLAVDRAFDGQEALDYLEVADYDVVILDVMMPIMDGFEVIQEMRHKRIDTPVLFLTARDQVEDKVQGLNLGADDYLVKPFAFPELLARLQVLGRRKAQPLKDKTYHHGPVQVDLIQKQVYKNQELMTLTAKEFQVLAYLIEKAGFICSRDQIREALWGFDYEGESNLIDVLVKNIRRKLDDDKQQSIIQTKRGEGYFVRKSDA